jgi:hypothetical protein
MVFFISNSCSVLDPQRMDQWSSSASVLVPTDDVGTLHELHV